MQSEKVNMDLQSGILETAKALGMDPLTLATIISFETAGTFDPMKKGPTTKWGTHRGLIQFGEPQAKQYGVDWGNPIASQLGADGAIARYFRASGWEPGMNELQAYATVNAGSPHKINASDAAAGGTWGTVSDKVNHQFGPHREKAAMFMGGKVPRKAPASKGVLSDLQTEDTVDFSLFDSFSDKGYEAGVLSMLGNEIQPQASISALPPPQRVQPGPEAFQRRQTDYLPQLLAMLRA